MIEERKGGLERRGNIVLEMVFVPRARLFTG